MEIAVERGTQRSTKVIETQYDGVIGAVQGGRYLSTQKGTYVAPGTDPGESEV